MAHLETSNKLRRIDRNLARIYEFLWKLRKIRAFREYELYKYAFCDYLCDDVTVYMCVCDRDRQNFADRKDENPFSRIKFRSFALLQEVPPESTECSEQEPDNKSRHEKSKKRKRKSNASPSHERKKLKCRDSLDCEVHATEAKKENVVNRCKLTSAYLAIDQLRVLTAMGGLFYAGRLSAVEPPDVYAITLDGERGNRPHIHSREEILRDAVMTRTSIDLAARRLILVARSSIVISHLR